MEAVPALGQHTDEILGRLGYSAAEIVGQSVGRIYPSMQEAHRVMAAMRSDEHGGPGKVKNFETIFVTRLGEQIPVAISGSVLYDENGLEIGSIGFAKDIREIRQRDRLEPRRFRPGCRPRTDAR